MATSVKTRSASGFIPGLTSRLRHEPPPARKRSTPSRNKNGRALDGTPIIATLSDIDSLFSQGYITKATRPDTDPLRYAIVR